MKSIDTPAGVVPAAGRDRVAIAEPVAIDAATGKPPEAARARRAT